MRSWTTRIAIALTLLAVGFAAGIMVNLNYSTDSSEDLDAAKRQIEALSAAEENSEQRLWRLYRERTAYKEQLEALQSETSSAAVSTDSPSPEGTLGDGMHIVDEDIAPGDYDGVVTDDFGYWARLKATDGTVNAIIENGLERGPFVLTVNPGDRAVELSGVTLTPR